MDKIKEKYLDNKNQEVIEDNIAWGKITEENEGIINRKDIEIIFSSFKYPDYFLDKDSRFSLDPRKHLDIFCDNSPSNISEIQRPIILIDHHTYETKYPDNFDYTSNCDMIMRNFLNIYNYLKETFKILNNSFQKINIFIHTDMDGIFSGLMVKYIIHCIYNNEEINKNNVKKYTREIILPYILGELGDISSQIGDIVERKLPQFNLKKLQNFQKYCNRLFKGFKNCIELDILECINDDFKYNDIEHRVLRSILILCNSYNVLSNSFFYYFINYLETSEDCLQLVSNVEFDINNNKRNIENLTLPMMVKFEGYEDIPYYFFVIESKYDIGRSLLWSYKGSNNKTKSFNNCGICVYNNGLRKLSSHSFDNDSSYHISKNLFGGGGHILKNGEALGSVEFNIETRDKLFKVIKLC